MSKYEVVEKLWSHAKFNVHIAQIPTEKINDKLAVLSDGSGTITFDRYDRFLLNTCLVDSGKVWSFIDSLEGDPETFVDAAVELRNIILEVNPLLDPKLLIINTENIIKLPEKDHTPDNSRLLIKNADWEKPEFEGPMGLEDIEDFIQSLPPPAFPVDPNMVGIDGSNLVAEMCKLLELLVTVIKYDSKDIPEIFKSKYTFEDAEPYRLFIVSKCILDFKSLFLVIDRMGMSRKHSPEKIAEELYRLAIKHNPFLSWDNIDLAKVKKAVIDKFGKSTRPKTDFSKSGAPPIPKPGKGKKDKSFTDRPGEEEGVEYYKNFDEISEEDVVGLPKRVKDWVIGQDEAVGVICETIQLAKCGLKEPGTPIGTFMLTGETGVGKTFSAKMFAKELCGDEHAVIRIDCSEYAQKHEVSKLIGSPQGYVGFEEGGYLTNAMAKTPFTVVLFDEIEKAHPKVHNILLQIMDEGRLTSNKGETVTFNDALVVLTSNIGVKEVQSVSNRVGMGSTSNLTKDKQEKAIKEALKNSFKPEFLNRLDGIVTFNRLNKEACLRIVDLAFDKLNGWLEDRKITVKYSAAVKDYIYSVGFKEGFGARPLNRAMKRYVMLPISKVMLDDKVKKDVTVTVTVKKNELNFTTKSNKKAPAKKGK